MNKKWTKIAALLGIFLLGLSLIGCGTESEKSAYCVSQWPLLRP